MSLDIFDIKLGKDAVMPRLDADNTGIVAVQVLDAIQTVVNVLTDNDGQGGWTVGFDPTMNAYTERTGGKRNIVVSVKPLLDAKPGTPLVNITKVMTGFAVHEVGHTKLNFFEAIVKRWPGKQLPIVLGNIIEDVVLEQRTVLRYDGFADHGEGNIFRPTLEWVAEQTCPKTPLKWSGSTGHKVNVTGQMVRYRDFVTFAGDEATQNALDFVETWMVGITPDLTPSGCVALIEALLDYIHAEPETPETPEPEPPIDFPKGPTTGPTIPNEDDDETEPEPPTEGGDDGEGNPEGGDGDGDDDDTEPGTEGDGDAEPDDDGQPGGDDDGEGKGDGPGRSGDGNDADHEARTESDKGTNDGPGKGGSGQSVSESDPDNGFDPADLDPSFDEVAKPEHTYEQTNVARAESDERVTTRLDAGIHGKMRVIFR
jgi:hypothetical protein